MDFSFNGRVNNCFRYPTHVISGIVVTVTYLVGCALCAPSFPQGQDEGIARQGLFYVTPPFRYRVITQIMRQCRI